MQTLNQSLAALYRKRDITLETALAVSSNEKELLDLVGRGHAPQGAAAAGTGFQAGREPAGGIRPQNRMRGIGDDPQY
jgi:hypothetical protein